MIAWRGKGWWTLVVMYAGLNLIPSLWHMQQGETWAQASRPTRYGTPFIVGMLFAGAVLTGWGLYLNRRQAQRVIEPETGRTYMTRPSHSFMHLKMEYWGIAGLVGGLLMLVHGR